MRNPYNVGAILRSAAFFGVDAALLGAPAPHPTLAPDAIRVAGGRRRAPPPHPDHTDLGRTPSAASAAAASASSAPTAPPAPAPRASPSSAPALLVLGHEREGLGPRVRAQCDAFIAVRGSGQVESLNVAVAAGVLIAEMVRREKV